MLSIFNTNTIILPYRSRWRNPSQRVQQCCFPFPEQKRMPQHLPRGKWFGLPVWYEDDVYKKPKHTRSIPSLVMETGRIIMNELAAAAGMAWSAGMSGQCWVLERAQTLSGSQQPGRDGKKRKRNLLISCVFFNCKAFKHSLSWNCLNQLINWIHFMWCMRT